MITVVVYNPITLIEVIFSCIIFLISCGIFGYSINVVGEIMDEIYREKQEEQKQILIINKYMTKKNISFPLRVKIRNYIDYLHSENLTKTSKEEGQIIEQLSQSLRVEILKEERWKIIKSIKSFEIFSDKILEKMMYYMEEMVLSDGQTIYCEGEYDDMSIYIIVKGSVQIFHECYRSYSQKGTVIKDLNQQDAFGQYGFFTGYHRQTSARSSDCTTIYKLKREDVISILQDFDQDFELFSQYKDQIIQQNQFLVKDMKCTTCQVGAHHLEKNCPDTHYVPDKYGILYRAECLILKYQQQPRSKYNRKRKIKKSNDIVKNILELEEFQKDCLFLGDYELSFLDGSRIESEDSDIDYNLQESNQIQEVDEQEENDTPKIQTKKTQNKKNTVKSNFSYENKNEKGIKSNLQQTPNNNKKKKNQGHSLQNSPNLKNTTNIQKKRQKSLCFQTLLEDVMAGFNEKPEKNIQNFEISTKKDTIPGWIAKTYKDNQLQNRRQSATNIAVQKLDQLSRTQTHTSSNKTKKKNSMMITEEDISKELGLLLIKQSSQQKSVLQQDLKYSPSQKSQTVFNFKEDQLPTQYNYQQQQQYQYNQILPEQFKKMLVQNHFDYIHEFKYYFPQDNASVIIENLPFMTIEQFRQQNKIQMMESKSYKLTKKDFYKGQKKQQSYNQSSVSANNFIQQQQIVKQLSLDGNTPRNTNNFSQQNKNN